MLKVMGLSFIILGFCAGCSDESNLKVATSNTPALGSEAWFAWVEEKVGTGDGQGHGPDYGSEEWCFVIEKKLFTNQSGVQPCTTAWEQKVTDKLQQKP